MPEYETLGRSGGMPPKEKFRNYIDVLRLHTSEAILGQICQQRRLLKVGEWKEKGLVCQNATFNKPHSLFSPESGTA